MYIHNVGALTPAPIWGILELCITTCGHAVGHKGCAKDHVGIEVRCMPHAQHMLLEACAWGAGVTRVLSNPAWANTSKGSMGRGR